MMNKVEVLKDDVASKDGNYFYFFLYCNLYLQGWYLSQI